jgi:hypothetical protein
VLDAFGKSVVRELRDAEKAAEQPERRDVEVEMLAPPLGDDAITRGDRRAAAMWDLQG